MKRRIISIIFILIGLVLIINSLSGITGFVVVEEITSTFSGILGIILLMGGLLLFVLERRERIGELEKILKLKKRLQQTLQSGRIGSYEELRRIADRMGYEIREGKFWTHVRKENEIIAKIPRHGRVATGTYRNIVKGLLRYAG